MMRGIGGEGFPFSILGYRRGIARVSPETRWFFCPHNCAYGLGRGHPKFLAGNICETAGCWSTSPCSKKMQEYAKSQRDGSFWVHFMLNDAG